MTIARVLQDSGKKFPCRKTEIYIEARRAYYACVSYIDTQTGMMLQSLKEPELPAHLQGNRMVGIIRGNDRYWKNTVFSEWQGAQCLFDHEADTGENENVAGKPEDEQVIIVHRKMIDSLYARLLIR